MWGLGLSGCAKEDISVSSAALSDSATYLWLASARSETRTQFFTTDEKATLSVRLAPNLIGMYQVFRVVWVAPTGHVYLRGPAQTKWGSHQELITELNIVGEGAENLPGTWRVQLFLGDTLMVERDFELVEGSQPTTMAELATNAEYRCPPVDQPPGRCIDQAPEE